MMLNAKANSKSMGGDVMANANRVCKLVIKIKRRIRPVVIKGVVEWHVLKDNCSFLFYTALNGDGMISLKDIVFFKYIKK